jgi:hypothetical protein
METPVFSFNAKLKIIKFNIECISVTLQSAGTYIVINNRYNPCIIVSLLNEN